ncbi:MAG: hypothetical protein LBJ89_03155 [Holosporales bacterium]|jgi:hypothetical protein|nr:hypothetical protein [Holosporales bacterium]
MQPETNGILSVANAVQKDLVAKACPIDLRNIRTLSYLVACAISARSVNTSWWKHFFPTQTRLKIRERRISRLYPVIKRLLIRRFGAQLGQYV